MKRRILLQNALVLLACLALIVLLDRSTQDEHRREAIKSVSDHTAQLLAEQVKRSIAALESIGAVATQAQVAPADTGNLLASFLPTAQQQGIRGLILLTAAGPVASACSGAGHDGGGHACGNGELAQHLPDYSGLPSAGQRHVVALPWSKDPELLRVAALPSAPASWVMPVGVRVDTGAWLFGLLSRDTFDSQITQSSELIKRFGYSDAYSYLIAADGNFTIAHGTEKNRGILVRSITGLESLSQAAASHQDDFQGYYLPGDPTSKVAYLANLRNTPAWRSDFPELLAWTLGTGVTDQSVWWQVGARAIYSVPALVVAWFAMWWFARRYLRLTRSELVEQLDRAARKLRQSGGPTGQDAGRGLDPAVEAALNRFIEASNLRRAEESSRYFAAIENPYIVGSPLHTPEVFFGRVDELKWAHDHLERPGNELLCFSGPRRIGKTSLLHRLRHDQVGGSRVFINAQRLLPSIQSDAHFYRLLGESIGEGLQGQCHDESLLTGLHESSTAQQLSAALRRLPDELRPLVLLIDELQTLETCLEHGTMTDAPLVWLGAELESPDVSLSLVTTGSTAWTRRRKSAWRVLQPRTVDRRVSVLPREVAADIVNKPLPLVHMPGQLLETLLDFSGGHPYLTQDVCFRLVRLLNKRKTYVVTPQILEQVMTEIQTDPPHVLMETWRNLRFVGRSVLSATADLIEHPSRTTNVHAISDRVRAHSGERATGLNRSRLLTVLHGLASEDLLTVRQGESVSFKCDVWRRWLRAYQPVVARHEQEALLEQ
jgi:hypothetical protein